MGTWFSNRDLGPQIGKLGIFSILFHESTLIRVQRLLSRISDLLSNWSSNLLLTQRIILSVTFSGLKINLAFLIGSFVCNTEMVLQTTVPIIFLGAAWLLTSKGFLLVVHSSYVVG